MNETELSAYEEGRTDTEEFYRKAIARWVALALTNALNEDGHDDREERRHIKKMILDGTDDGTIEGACDRFMWEDVNGCAFVTLVRGMLKYVRQA